MGLKKAFIRKLAAKFRRMRHEEHYDQGIYLKKTSCGTAACIAGHAVLEGGWKPTLDVFEKQFTCEVRKGDAHEDVEQVASGLTGIPFGSWVFSGEPYADWPEEFAKRWKKKRKTGPNRPSRIAADLLEAVAAGKYDPEGYANDNDLDNVW